MWSLILSFLGYIFWQGMSAAIHYGPSNLFLNFEFQLSGSKVSFWPSFGVTVFLALVTVLLTIPAALKCSIWISFYCPKKYTKAISTLLLILANVPSVVLAIYVRRYLSSFLRYVFLLDTSLNLLVASIALVCMILPLIIVLFNSAMEGKRSEIISGELLGLDKNYAINKIIVPKIKGTILIATTFIIGKAMSESIMLSMLLSSENYAAGYGNGFSSFINSQLNGIAPLIGENYFSDGSSEHIQNLMFLFGGLLLASSLICNSVFLEWMKRDRKRIYNTKTHLLTRRIRERILWTWLFCFHKQCRLWSYGQCRVDQFIYLSPTKVSRKIKKYIRRFLEFFFLGLFIAYASTLIGTVAVSGISAIFSEDPSPVAGNDTLSRAIKNTFMIVFLAIVTAIPIALLSAIYLSEYAKNGRFKKYSLSLINAASSTPSIIFGIFGLFIFIQKLGLTSSGASGKSLLAGILTIILFILPYLTQLFYTNISNIHFSYRESSYILGIPKSTTFWKILLPIAFNDLVFSILLTMGKILGETAPLYLTAGINSVPGSLFMYQGQTLTTRIYSQLYETNLKRSEKIIGETSFYCLLFISLIVVLAQYSNKLLNNEWWKKLMDKRRHVAN